MTQENNASSLQQHLKGGSVTVIEKALNLVTTIGFLILIISIMIMIGIPRVITINSLNSVVQLSLLVVDTTIVGKRLPMKLLSFFTVVVTMYRLRKIGSTVEVLSFITSLSQTTYQLLNMPTG